jgi:peptide/nickel transport system substrate-binding protein
MNKWGTLLALLMTLTMLLACSPAKSDLTTSPTANADSTSKLTTALIHNEKSLSGEYLTPNPVENSMPIYGGTLSQAITGLRSFDAHQLVGYGPTVTLPIFNQLVMFDLNYKETVPETVVGDLADNWETSEDGTEIVFHLHKGVKWQDGVPFTSDDVVYSLEKMTDVNRSAISSWFPAYQSVEKIDENTVKVHLKYASAGFMLALAQGESQVQPYHLSGNDDQSAAFAIGTGPFILTEYLPGVHFKYKRNPDYWKKDKYGNWLPYLDGIIIYKMSNASIDDALIARRLDLKGTVTGSAGLDTYNTMKNGAPELLWQRRDRVNGYLIYLNTSKSPLNDIRIRRAMGLILKEEDLIIGGCGDVIFGLPDAGILYPAWGLPKEEVNKLMGWDKPYNERVTEAQQLMTEAGYENGLKLTMLASAGTTTNACLVFGDELRNTLKIETNVVTNVGTIEMFKRVGENNYDGLLWDFTVMDPIQVATFFATGGAANYSQYSNPKLDEILADLDHVLDPDLRREEIQNVDRILLTDLPALPTGLFPANMMPYYPWVKNLRWNYISYSNINRLEDVWIDESLR